MCEEAPASGLHDSNLCSTLINSIRGIVWEADPLTFRFFFVSPHAERILGYPVRQWIDEPDFWRTHTHPDDVAWCGDYCRDAALKGEDHEFQYRMIAADGRVVWLHDIVTVVRAENGELRLRGIMFDITENKKIEERLRSEEERFQLAMQGANDGLWDWNLVTDEVYYSTRWKAMLGYGDEELENHLRTWNRLVHPDDRDSTLAQVKDFLEGRLDRYEVEFRMRHKAGHYLNILSRAKLSSDAQGKPVRLVGTHIDITDRKNAERRLKASEERYAILFNNSHDAVIIHDLKGRVLDVNQTMLDMFAVTREEILRMNIAEDLSGSGNPLDMLPKIWNGVLGGKYLCFEWSGRRPHDNSSFPVEVCLRRISFGDGDLILANVHDITERRIMQDEIIKSQKLESLGTLAGGIAHDFNNILTAILGNLSFVRLQMDSANILSKRLEECEKAVSRAGELTRQLLTFSRGGEPAKKMVSPASLIGDATSLALRGSNAKCITELADSLWCIEADEGQISQVLHNLMLNAAQAMPSGGEVTVRAFNEQLGSDNPLMLKPGPYLTITVTDHGCGIPRNLLTRIFDPYFTTKTDGTGLGLASAYSIVRRHGGGMEVASTVGEGSCFTVHLPASPGNLPEEEKARTKPGPARSGRILIMDDNDMIREIATQILELLGYEVESCADGREAIVRFRLARESGRPFSAVILDLTIPGGMGGKEAAPLILEIDPDALLIVSSGYSSDPVVASFREYGFSGVINKPFDANRLGGELENLLKGHGKSS